MAARRRTAAGVAMGLLLVACAPDGPVSALTSVAVLEPAVPELAPNAPAEPESDSDAEAEPHEHDETARSVTGAITVDAQALDGSALHLRSVRISGADGWVAVHGDVDGAPGAVLGTVFVPEGAHDALVVDLDEPVEPGGRVWPMLHVDDGEAEVYEFPAVPGADLPVADGDAPVMVGVDVLLP